MKTHILTLVSFLFCLTLSAQTYQKYPTQNGTPSIFPSTTVKPGTSPNTLNVYQNKNGIPSITPTAVIKKKDE
ncbi:hypothetical protein [Aquiflexum lacus]|uniref:hypothetical protein n=1 Tax=Aquiflexum lacus TaxID=2483805 RepID=UPI00189417B9|nr:hypothetical protein [Aquiflexum lacus]